MKMLCEQEVRELNDRVYVVLAENGKKLTGYVYNPTPYSFGLSLDVPYAHMMGAIGTLYAVRIFPEVDRVKLLQKARKTNV